MEFSLWHSDSGLCARLDQNTEWMGDAGEVSIFGIGFVL